MILATADEVLLHPAFLVLLGVFATAMVTGIGYLIKIQRDERTENRARMDRFEVRFAQHLAEEEGADLLADQRLQAADGRMAGIELGVSALRTEIRDDLGRLHRRIDAALTDSHHG